jgi:D-alanine--poly(phosphoribitol) ligase subunit 2
MEDLLELLREVLGGQEELDADTPLISSGLVDSFGAVSLIVELESRYGVTVEPEEIDAQTFDTPRQILEHIAARSR